MKENKMLLSTTTTSSRYVIRRNATKWLLWRRFTNRNHDFNNHFCRYSSSTSPPMMSPTSPPPSSSSSSPSSPSLPSPPQYRVAKITSSGKLTYECKTVGEILRESSSMHARDLFSLNLTSTSRNENYQYANDRERNKISHLVRPPAAILPREKDIIMSFGTIRALISPNSGIIFDAHTPTVELVAEELSILFQKISANNEEKATLKQDQKYTENDNANANDGDDEPFELVFIEEVLREVCDMYARRLKLYEPIVNAVSSRVTNEMFAATGIHRLVPVKDSIQEFEIQVQSALDCLKHLLDNDEDMVGLLLQKKTKAKHEGYELDLKNHEAVELLIEEYARRLNSILHETNYLLKKVETKQELIAISLDAYRNRMIRMDLYLSIAGIGLGASTMVAGYYGMNLIHGLEESPTAFTTVVVSTTAVGMLIGAGCVSYISGFAMRRRTMKKLDEITMIDDALSHLNSMDYVVKYMVSKNKVLNKTEFTKKIKESQPTSNVNDEEADLLFNAFDVSKDGMLYIDDLQAFAHLDIHSKSRYDKKSGQK